jgi:hypothetical protein
VQGQVEKYELGAVECTEERKKRLLGSRTCTSGRVADDRKMTGTRRGAEGR